MVPRLREHLRSLSDAGSMPAILMRLIQVQPAAQHRDFLKCPGDSQQQPGLRTAGLKSPQEEGSGETAERA